MSSLPDPGTPPEAVLANQKRINALLNSEVPETRNRKQVKKKQVTSVKFDDFTPLKFEKQKETVTLENESILFEFSVTDFCETDLALIFVLDPEDFRITPKKDTSFNLQFRDKVYPVYYIGRTIHFVKYDIHQIIFIRNLDAT